MAAELASAVRQISAFVASRYPFSPNTDAAARRILARVASPSRLILMATLRTAPPDTIIRKDARITVEIVNSIGLLK
jgi:hypothetical protein